MKKTKNRLIKIVVILTILITNVFIFKGANVFAYPENESDFYEYISMLGLPKTLKDGKVASWPTYRDYNIIVWGKQHGRFKNGSLCKNDSEYEYLGYDKQSNDVTNRCFPNDDSSGQHPKKWNFISVAGGKDSWKEIDTDVKSHIKNSPWVGNGATSTNPLYYKDIGSEDKVRVEVAPSWRGKGSVFTQNRGNNGKIYYATFIVPALAGDNQALVDGDFETDKDTYTINPDDASVKVNYTVTAKAKISGYMRYSHISELKATYKKSSSKTSGQSTTKLKDSFELTRDNYGAGTYNLTLEGTVSLKTKFNDNESKKVFKKITLVVKKATQPTMSVKGATDPGTKKFDKGQTVTDVPVKVTATGTLKGLEDTSKITKYQLLARKEEDKTDVVKEFTGSSAKKLSQSNVFNFTIPKSKIGKNEYTQTFKVQAKAYLNDGNVISSSATVRTMVYPPGIEEPTSPEPPVPENPEPSNEPPTVTIIGPETVRAGDNICLNSNAFDTDGTIESQSWTTPGAMGSISGSNGCIIYPKVGDYLVTTTVTDDKGATGSDIHYIEVTPPYPNAYFTVTGTLKENRKVTFTDATDTPSLYPVDWSKSYWEIKANDPLNQQYVRYKGKLTDNPNKVIDSLFKKQGDYTITLSVTNTAGYSDTYERTIHINEDEKPIADFSTVNTIYRDNVNNNLASIKLTDNSYSPDYDTISQRIWKYKFDSNNDGNFDDEKWQIIDDGNLEYTELNVNRVGKYLIELEDVEAFGQETIPEFITANDYKKGDTTNKNITDKVVEVKNLAPNVSFQVGKRKTVEMNVDMGDVNNNPYTVSTIESKLNSTLKPLLNDEGIDLKLNVKERPSLDYPEILYLFTTGKYIETSEWSGYSEDYLYYYDEASNGVKLVDSLPILQRGAVDYDGNIYYMHRYGNNIIYKFNIKSKNIENIEFPSSVDSWIVGQDNKLYVQVGNNTAATLYVYNPTTKSINAMPNSLRGSLIATAGNKLISKGDGYYDQYLHYYNLTTNQVQQGEYFNNFPPKKIIGISDDYYLRDYFGYGNGFYKFLEGYTFSTGKTNNYTDSNYNLLSYVNDFTYIGNNKLLMSLDNSSPAPFNQYKGTYEYDLSQKVPLKPILTDQAIFYYTNLNSNSVYLYSGGLKKYNLKTQQITTLPYKEVTKDDLVDDSYYNSKGKWIEYYYLPRLETASIPVYPSFRNGTKDIVSALKETKWESGNDSYKFFVALSNNNISGLPEKNNEAANELKSNDIQFISLGTDKTKSVADTLIKANNNKGVSLDINNLDDSIHKMEDYIIKTLNQFPVDLDFDVGNTSKNDIDTLKTKLNQIVMPKLNDESIHMNEPNFLNTAIPLSQKVNIGPGSTNGGTATSSLTFGARLKVDKEIVLSSIGVELGTNVGPLNPKIRFGIWDSVGALIVKSDDVTPQPNINNFKLPKSLTLEPNKDYYIGVYSPSGAGVPLVTSTTQTQQTTRAVGGVNFTFQSSLYSGREGFVVPSTTIGNASNWYLDFVTPTKNKIKPHSVDSLSFYNILDDQIIDSDRKRNILDNASVNNAYVNGMGTKINSNDMQDIINKNNNRGSFIDNSDLDNAFEQLADNIIQEVNKKRDGSEIYITTDQAVNYFTYYNDSENDPKYSINGNTGERWKYIHDPNVFENPMGTYSKNNVNQDSPVTQFSQTGAYKVIHAERDNPVDTDNRFDNYRMWSKEIDNWTIFVHRKPIANFLFNFNSLDGTYSIKNKAYDLDKQSVDIGYGGGIRYLEYQWREKDGDGIWNDGLPPSPLERKFYEVKQTVYDFQGASATTSKIIDTTGLNHAPVADFDPIPSTVKLGDTINFKNLSYDPNGDDLTTVWSIKKSNSTDSFADFSTDFDSKRNMTAIGDFDVKLKVTDPFGQSDEITKTVHVIPKNSPPKAGFQYTTPLYIGDTIYLKSTATDPDNDPLKYVYTVKKPNGTTKTYSSGDPEVNAQGDLTLKANNLNTDLGNWIIEQTVSDGQENDSVSATIQVLDQTLKGTVSHTPKWEQNRQKFNLRVSGNINSPRGPSVFFPGEKFILNAEAAQTATQVQVKIDEYPDYVTYLDKVNNTWQGSLWDEKMIDQFKDQELTFSFTALYSNGWITTYKVKVQIKDDPYWRQHTVF